ncbi:MAG: hypothetical protein EOO46_21700 [Flavobacterium sp.]|nr:MAG: hypothetical protein EOO46_21700 [Flavobacterium sp.]
MQRTGFYRDSSRQAIFIQVQVDQSFQNLSQVFFAVDPHFISINANGSAGTFYGIQTLIQLLPASNIKSQTSNLK